MSYTLCEVSVEWLLYLSNITDKKQYEVGLQQAFLQDPTNDTLLKLQWATDAKDTVAIWNQYYNTLENPTEEFRKILVEKLKEHYENCSDLELFAKNTYRLWKNLPFSYDVKSKDPFLILSYIDDPFSWGDEEQVHTLYQSFFNYDKEKGKSNLC